MAEKKVPLDQKKKPEHRKKKINDADKEIRNKKIKKSIKIALLVMAGLFIIVCGAGTALVISYIKDAPQFDAAQFHTVQTSYVYDIRDEVITPLHGGENRVAISLEEIPKHVQEAFLAIEDERFYRHFGFDIIGFTRAVFVNIRDRSFTQGASTITQQLAQLTFLSQTQTVKRKVQEIWLAIQTERVFSKEEILEMYLNRIYFGNHAYGIETAAQTYFDKNVEELSIAEAAMLAGLINLPEFYNPFYSEEQAQARKKEVLANMQRIGFIDQEQYREAVEAELAYGEPSSIEYPYPYFIDYVVHYELIDILTSTPDIGSEKEAYDAIYYSGLHIYTTMDTPIQAHVEDLLNKHEMYHRTIYVDMAEVRELLKTLPDGTETMPRSLLDQAVDEENGIPQPQASIVLIDPTTGAVRALGGGREYRKKANEVLRFTSRRQPGSAIKPIITYAPAFEEGILAGAGSTIDDSPYSLGSWYPENFDRNFRGLVSARQALIHSYNIPAVRVYQDVGLQTGAEYARRAGLSTIEPSNAVTSWTLGSREVTVLDMAEAFGVLANSGMRMDSFTVRKIVDRSGNVIYEHKSNPEQVFSPQSTFLVNDILQGFVTDWLGRSLQIDRPIAAKTGTTDDAKDIYLAAYTPNVVAALWMGYDEPRMGGFPEDRWRYTTNFLREVFLEVFPTLEIVPFKQPSGIVTLEVCSKSGLLATDLCHAAGTVRSDYFTAIHAPRMSCDMHVEVAVCAESGLLPSEFCPHHLIETRLFLDRPDFLTTDDRWDGKEGRKPADADKMPPRETCDTHAEHLGQFSSFTATAQNHNKITLSWEYSGEDLAMFHLYRKSGDEETAFLAQISANRISYDDRNVTGGTSYIYTLYAVNSGGSYSAPATDVAETPQPGRPGRPTLHKSEPGTASEEHYVNLAWSGADTYAASFIVQRHNGNGNFQDVAAVDGSVFSYIDIEGLNPGTTYTYRIIARSQNGDSEPSNELSATIEDESGNGNDNGGGNGDDNGGTTTQ